MIWMFVVSIIFICILFGVSIATRFVESDTAFAVLITIAFVSLILAILFFVAHANWKMQQYSGSIELAYGNRLPSWELEHLKIPWGDAFKGMKRVVSMKPIPIPEITRVRAASRSRLDNNWN